MQLTLTIRKLIQELKFWMWIYFPVMTEFNEKVKCPDLCIHLAWQDGFVHNSPKHMENLSKAFYISEEFN